MCTKARTWRGVSTAPTRSPHLDQKSASYDKSRHHVLRRENYRRLWRTSCQPKCPDEFAELRRHRNHISAAPGARSHGSLSTTGTRYPDYLYVTRTTCRLHVRVILPPTG